jgi:hypothetical protein
VPLFFILSFLRLKIISGSTIMTTMDEVAKLDDEAFLRAVTPPFEDWRRMTSKPHIPGQHRWFRSANVADLMTHRRNRGLIEWHERDPWAGLTVESLRIPATPPPRRVWPSNVVDMTFRRGQKAIWPRPPA